MRRFSVTQLLLVVTWCAIAISVLARYFAAAPYQGATFDVEGVTNYNYAFNERFEVTITKQMVELSPAWNPADANPPVSAREALAIADRLRREHLRDEVDLNWGLESIALLPMDAANNKWCWKILFTLSHDTRALTGDQLGYAAYVLMNGTAVVPEGHQYPFLDEQGLLRDEPAKEAASQ